MGRDKEIIAGPQNANILIALKKQAGASGQEYDPLVSVLVVPLTRRRCLTCGHNALQLQSVSLYQRFDDFAV
jgi:hypothetical protein